MSTPINGALPSNYCVGTPSARANWTNPDCQPLTEIYHVTHVEHAVAIAREQQFRPRLVYDTSLLNKSRTTVNWLSPNIWHKGSRYGTVRFVFDWDFHNGRQAYWVEAINYKPHAPRILLTDDPTVPTAIGLTTYDPRQQGAGPWYIDGDGEHWWNGDVTLEVMLHDQIKTSEVSKVEFTRHNKGMCSIHSLYPGYCPDVELTPSETGGFFIAALVSQELTSLNHALVENNVPTDELLTAWVWLRDVVDHAATRTAKPVKFVGNVQAASSQGPALAHATLNAMYNRQKSASRNLLSLFSSATDAINAFRVAIAAHFQIPAATLT